MRTEKFFEILLEFGEEWKVKEVESVAQSDEVDIYVEYVGGGKVHDFAPPRRWRHLDIMQYKTYINAALPRLKMRDGSVKTVTPPWADKHERHTFLYEIAVIETLLATKNQTSTMNLMRCSFDIVNRILHNTTSNAMAERLNGKIQLLKSVGRGYRKFENFRSAILFFYGKLSLFPLKYQ